MAAKETYKEISAIAKARRAAAIPPHLLLDDETLSSDLPLNVTTSAQRRGHFTADELTIIESEAGDILRNVREGVWTAVEVTQAFCHAAAIAQQLTNCLTEVFFEEALSQARALDEHRTRTGTVVGPLHGLPISLKDCFITPPHPSSIGMSRWANVPTTPPEESTLVTLLRSLGAIFYVKTNTPVALMMLETNNHVWGETRNPIHRLCSSGGSSGGEGALIACHGSPLGVGTDIGGSIRTPSAFCGLYGLRPSTGRFPHWSYRSAIPGQEFVASVDGPMSRSLNSLSLFGAAVLSPAAHPWTTDPKCLPIPWRPGPHILPQGRPLRLGLLPPHDGAVTAHPPVQRALEETAAALRAAGHEVVEWSPLPEHPATMKLLMASFFDYGGLAVIDDLEAYGEPAFASMFSYWQIAALEKRRTQAAAAARERAEAAGHDADIGSGSSLTTARLRKSNLERGALCKSYLDRWAATADPATGKGPIDALIAPVSPWTACRLGVTDYDLSDPSRKGPGPYFGYTTAFNVMDLVSCAFPVTVADKAKDAARKPGEWSPLGDMDARVQADYDPDFYHGTPVGLQCVAPKLQEEVALEVVGIVKAALKAAGVE